MLKTVIADSSCFIILSNIGELTLLSKVFGQVVTTIEVSEEFGEPLPDWVEIKASSDKYRKQILEMQVDKGEASAIALALEIDGCTLIVDDYKARKIAVSLGIEITGTLGVIIKAKLNGTIPSIKPYLEKIKRTDFRMSEELLLQALRESGE
jgi:predicted nucleic acid-binding protein